MRASSGRRWSGRDSLIAAGIALLAILVFLPARRFDFINLDDWGYVRDNLHVLSGLSAANVRWAFTTFTLSNYHPLTWLGYMTLAQLFGPQPAAYHLANILLHGVNAALVYVLLAGLTRARGRSALVALLFAVHPLRMESVAWVAEFKDVLCGMFFLLVLIAYGRYARGEKPKHARAWYAAALVAFVLGLFAKPMLVTVPGVLLLVDCWPLKRPARWGALVVEKVPFIVLALASSVVTYVAQRVGGAVAVSGKYPLALRVGNAVWGYGRYLRKTIWPSDLAVYYPYYGVVPGTKFPWLLAAVSAAVLLAVTALAVLLWRRERAVLVGWLWFCGMLVPTIGIVQVGTQSMADRYSYLPHIGLLIAIVWGAAAVLERWPALERAAAVGGGAAVAVLAGVTMFQLPQWQNSYAIFKHALAVTDYNAPANASLSRYLQLNGKPEAALAYAEEALRIDPDTPDVETYVGGLLRDLRRPAEALPHLERAMRLNAHDPDARNNLANTLADLKRWDEAAVAFEDALRVAPDRGATWFNYAVTLATAGRIEQALPKFERAMTLRPDDANIRYAYGLALSQAGQDAAAARQLSAALQLRPNWPQPAAALAWLLATTPDDRVRDPRRAVAITEALNRATVFSDADLLDKLAAAYAAAGRFDQAIATARRARDLAASAGRGDLAQQIGRRIALYESGKPFVAAQVQPATQSSPANRSSPPARHRSAALPIGPRNPDNCAVAWHASWTSSRSSRSTAAGGATCSRRSSTTRSTGGRC